MYASLVTRPESGHWSQEWNNLQLKNQNNFTVFKLLSSYHQLLDNTTVSMTGLQHTSGPTNILQSSKKTINLAKLNLGTIPGWYFRLLSANHSITCLNLSSNKIVELPPEIGLMRKLEILNLQENFIDYLPSELSKLHNLKKVKLKDNPLSYIPKSAQKSAKMLRSYLETLRECSTQWHRVKLLIVGDQGVGKTVRSTFFTLNYRQYFVFFAISSISTAFVFNNWYLTTGNNFFWFYLSNRVYCKI